MIDSVVKFINDLKLKEGIAFPEPNSFADLKKALIDQLLQLHQTNPFPEKSQKNLFQTRFSGSINGTDEVYHVISFSDPSALNNHTNFSKKILKQLSLANLNQLHFLRLFLLLCQQAQEDNENIEKLPFIINMLNLVYEEINTDDGARAFFDHLIDSITYSTENKFDPNELFVDDYLATKIALDLLLGKEKWSDTDLDYILSLFEDKPANEAGQQADADLAKKKRGCALM